MATAIFAMCALLVAFFFPLVAPWHKTSFNIWLIAWFCSWLLLFYLLQFESSHYRKGHNSTFVWLLLASLVAGGLIRAINRGITVWVRQRQERQIRSLASGP